MSSQGAKKRKLRSENDKIDDQNNKRSKPSSNLADRNESASYSTHPPASLEPTQSDEEREAARSKQARKVREDNDNFDDYQVEESDMRSKVGPKRPSNLRQQPKPSVAQMDAAQIRPRENAFPQQYAHPTIGKRRLADTRFENEKDAVTAASVPGEMATAPKSSSSVARDGSGPTNRGRPTKQQKIQSQKKSSSNRYVLCFQLLARLFCLLKGTRVAHRITEPSRSVRPRATSIAF